MGGAEKKKTHLPIQTLFMKFRAAKVWSYPTQSVPESSRFAFGSGLGILIGSPGGSLGSHQPPVVTTEAARSDCWIRQGRFSRRAAANHTPKTWGISDIFQGTKQCLMKVHLYKPLYKKRGKSILRLALYFCNSMLEFTSDLFDFHYFCRRQIWLAYLCVGTTCCCRNCKCRL